MKTAFFSTKRYDEQSFEKVNADYHHELTFFEPRLMLETATLASGFPAVCTFINDDLSAGTLRAIAAAGTQLIALRCAGFNNVDLNIAQELGIKVVRVPAYSPYAVAEHAVGLIMALNRKLYRAYNRVRDDNFSLEGLIGFDLYGKTVGVVGTGKIGQCFAQIMKGFGCKILAYDIRPNPVCLEIGVNYVELPELLKQSDIISLHCPLLPSTHHLINADSLQHFKPGAMLINTSRGGLINTKAVIHAIKSGQVGYFGIDVYEHEDSLFFEDLSDTVIQDDTFQLLQSFSNVVITAHQAFFTKEALQNIAETTLSNISDIDAGRECSNEIKAT
ncbi:lactate dehydrogenase-like oxidoreductase [Leptolyngbya sp. Heron Island J]|uniref:2-hydroxyacid dehydrogenase n=1 Tax=Leptolyngbya sp. Heron Island J TaxID=1385935 RepID=UPI0003B94453|nr:2-hydroxyacid dehydrogenase [Leptolyngbya sp. Heron Island J]ESA36533.1 lactate dehydrogenase-like oxidoreductase [Leptolyngbya sp. Heron Island J]